MGVIKKFHLVLISLFLLVITFGTVTFAWISLSTVNNIEGLSLSASSGEELLISLDGENFSNNLSPEQLQSLFADITLNEVTSLDGITFNAGGLRDEDDVNHKKDYLQFDLWFQTTENVHDVYLIENVSQSIAFDTTANGTYIVSRGVSWRSDHEFIYDELGTVVEKGEKATYYASDAVRVSFVELKDDFNVLDERDENELSSWIFDPSGDPVRGYGKLYGAYSYFVAKTEYYMLTPTSIQEVVYDLTEVNPRNPYEALDNQSKVMELQNTGLTNESGLSIYQGKLRVTLWVEGWDADAFDAIHGDRLKIQLQFKLLKEAETNLD